MSRWPIAGALRRTAALAVLVVVGAAVAVLAGWPPYHPLAPDQAVIKVSVLHSGVLLGECRTLTDRELEKLPPNMRAPEVCPRERSPVLLQLDVDGRRLIDERLEPQGLHDDGRAAFYRRLVIPAGTVRIQARLQDDVRRREFPYQQQFTTHLEPGRALIVDFDGDSGSFVFL